MVEKVYTVKEIAQILHTNVAYVYELIKAGLMNFLKLGAYKVRESELNRFIAWAEGKDVTDPEHPVLLDERQFKRKERYI